MQNQIVHNNLESFFTANDGATTVAVVGGVLMVTFLFKASKACLILYRDNVSQPIKLQEEQARSLYSASTPEGLRSRLDAIEENVTDLECSNVDTTFPELPRSTTQPGDQTAFVDPEVDRLDVDDNPLEYGNPILDISDIAENFHSLWQIEFPNLRGEYVVNHIINLPGYEAMLSNSITLIQRFLYMIRANIGSLDFIVDNLKNALAKIVHSVDGLGLTINNYGGILARLDNIMGQLNNWEYSDIVVRIVQLINQNQDLIARLERGLPLLLDNYHLLIGLW